MLRVLSLFAFAFVASLFFLPACQSSCASNDDCEGADVCVFNSGKCAPKCTPGKAGTCSASTSCDACATSSTPTSKDCVAACVDNGGGGQQQGGW